MKAIVVVAVVDTGTTIRIFLTAEVVVINEVEKTCFHVTQLVATVAVGEVGVLSRMGRKFIDVSITMVDV